MDVEEKGIFIFATAKSDLLLDRWREGDGPRICPLFGIKPCHPADQHVFDGIVVKSVDKAMLNQLICKFLRVLILTDGAGQLSVHVVFHPEKDS